MPICQFLEKCTYICKRLDEAATSCKTAKNDKKDNNN